MSMGLYIFFMEGQFDGDGVAAEAEVKYQLAIRTLQTRVELATHLWSLPCIWLRELWSLGSSR